MGFGFFYFRLFFARNQLGQETMTHRMNLRILVLALGL